jgi:S1-C subfamily serine protease
MRILSLILTVAGLASSAGLVRGDESIPPDVLAAIKKATVFVKVQVEGQRYSGSGFVVKVDDGAVYVVTNHHVIEPKLIEIVAQWRSGPRMPAAPHGPHGHLGPRLPPGPAAPSLTPRLVVRTLKDADVTVVFRSGTPQEQAVHAEVLAADPEVDLAILKAVDVKNLPSPVDCSRDIELSETMPVFSFGFPFGEVLATSKGSPAITIGKASISSLRLDDAGQLALVQIDGALNPGNSGGPLPRSRTAPASAWPFPARKCPRCW